MVSRVEVYQHNWKKVKYSLERVNGSPTCEDCHINEKDGTNDNECILKSSKPRFSWICFGVSGRLGFARHGVFEDEVHATNFAEQCTKCNRESYGI